MGQEEASVTVPEIVEADPGQAGIFLEVFKGPQDVSDPGLWPKAGDPPALGGPWFRPFAPEGAVAGHSYTVPVEHRQWAAI